MITTLTPLKVVQRAYTEIVQIGSVGGVGGVGPQGQGGHRQSEQAALHSSLPKERAGVIQKYTRLPAKRLRRMASSASAASRVVTCWTRQ